MSISGDIAKTLAHKDVLLCAEPGAGKSTALPLALLNSKYIKGNIVLLEPRRLAARSVAARLATHIGEEIGQQVGLRMRLDTRVSKHTRLTVVTEGVLTQMLQKDPSLDGISLIIFDEFHERSLHADLGMALCLEVKQALREDLRLLIMSATLDTVQIDRSINNLELYQCSVRQHDVQILWEGEHSGNLHQRVAQTVLKALNAQSGDVLVFLPGLAEIVSVERLLSHRLNETVVIHRLHSNISLTDQVKATASAVQNQRRIILSTSIAETSITIDGVTVVVDSGLERRGRIDTRTGAQRLETVQASQASATQRSGRAGRNAPGVCYRLWSESGHKRRPAQWQPEIFRADLSPLLLDLGLWGATNVDELPWLEAPPASGISQAQDLLSRLNLCHKGKLNERGREAARLPVHPRLSNMLLWAEKRNQVSMACIIAATLEELPRLSRTINFEHNINSGPSNLIKHRAAHLEKYFRANIGEARDAPTAILLAQAFPDWIAQKRVGENGRFQLSCGAGVIVDNDSDLAHCEWLVAVQLGGSGSQLKIYKAIEVSITQLENNCPDLFTDEVFLDWDHRQQKVIAEQRRMIGSLVVVAKPCQNISESDKARALLNGIRSLDLDCLPWTEECRQWQARVQKMKQITTKQRISNWPDVDDTSLIQSLEIWLLPWLDGIGSLKALQKINLYNALNTLLDYQQQTVLEEYLPVRYTVPTGSKIRLNYLNSSEPILSVRLQEMLGCDTHPTVADRQLALKIELLSPAHRPVQVTADLVNFWSTSYPIVKKEMKGRYPKHYWPEDPMSALPTTKAKPRKS